MAEAEQEVKIIERNCDDYGRRGRYGRSGWDCDGGEHERGINRWEFQMIRDYEKELAAKEHALNLSDMERTSDRHDIELYKQLHGEIKDVGDKLDREVRRIDAVNAAQTTYNATQTAMLHTLENQIDELMHVTRRVVPRGSVYRPVWHGYGADAATDENPVE